MVRLIVLKEEVEVERTCSPTRSRPKPGNCKTSGVTKKPITIMKQQSSVKRARPQSPAIDQTVCILRQVDGSTETVRLETHSKKDHTRRKEWTRMFRRRSSPERRDDGLDTRGDLPSLVDNKHSNKKVPLWRRHWKKHRQKKPPICSTQCEQRPSGGEKNVIGCASTVKEAESQKQETSSVDTTGCGEIAEDESAGDEACPAHSDIAIEIVSEENYNRPVREGLERNLNVAGSYFSLALPTQKEGLSQRLASENRKENGDEDRIPLTPLSKAQTFTENVERREEPYPAPKIVMANGIFGIPSCYRDTTALPLPLPSSKSNKNRRNDLSDMSHQGKDLGQNWISEPQKTFPAGFFLNCQGVKTRKRGTLTLPSCTRGTASLPLTLSSEEDYIAEKVTLPDTVTVQDPAFAASVRKTFRIGTKTVDQCIHKKSTMEATPSCHRDAASLSSELPPVETAIGVSIALSDNPNERLDTNRYPRIHGITSQNSVQIEEEPHYQVRSILALLTCHRDTTSPPSRHPAVDGDIDSKLKDKDSVGSLRCLSREKKLKIQSRASGPALQTAPVKIKPPRSMGELLRQNWSGLDPDLVVPRHNLLSFSSFSNASGDALNALPTAQLPSSFPKGLNCIALSGPLESELVRSITTEGDSYSSLSDPDSFVGASLNSSPNSLEISEFVDMAETDMKDVYSDLSSFSLSYASSDSHGTFFLSDELEAERHVAYTVGGADSDRLRQIANELQIDPADLVRRLEAGQDIKNVIHDELLKRNITGIS